MSNKNFYPLLVSDIQTLAEHSKIITFQIAAELQPFFEYTAGQYLTLKINIGEQIRIYQ